MASTASAVTVAGVDARHAMGVYRGGTGEVGVWAVRLKWTAGWAWPTGEQGKGVGFAPGLARLVFLLLFFCFFVAIFCLQLL